MYADTDAERADSSVFCTCTGSYVLDRAQECRTLSPMGARLVGVCPTEDGNAVNVLASLAKSTPSLHDTGSALCTAAPLSALSALSVLLGRAVQGVGCAGLVQLLFHGRLLSRKNIGLLFYINLPPGRSCFRDAERAALGMRASAAHTEKTKRVQTRRYKILTTCQCIAAAAFLDNVDIAKPRTGRREEIQDEHATHGIYLAVWFRRWREEPLLKQVRTQQKRRNRVQPRRRRECGQM
ncbi:hypothetical protein CMQ_3852 [Grosmannia clavigera kw1407]|uniref:Uncharacterized protein n=1 Tax=Grosmannia clavigera (strain kw1407 / UAMH 11150) TaxID=655863 RepID=F0XA59_GROCL|nr:uncharacterized protein CMQ_3852 [Grosmannia clavigera kw1407]EFX05783.1 hypothetical protein CMQ_3852 [Grosmannia clavigera kw1407]